MPAKKKKKSKIHPEVLRQKLKLKHLAAKKKLSEAHPHVEKFFQEKGLDPGKLREHSARLIGSGMIAGSLLLNPPSATKALPPPHEVIEKLKIKGLASESGETKKENAEKKAQKILVETFESFLPKRPRPLERSEEKFLEQVFQNLTGVPARATLEGEHLNTTFGYIGAEQHLRRFPGDTLLQHAPEEDEYGGDRKGEMLKEGIAPGLGAWGYFAPSKSEFTEDLEEKERWYAVVQTLYLPDWNTRQPYLKNWYKFRKVFIVNTDNGKAVVASIADSGPAAWTGKHFGGSPEVMDYLGGPRYKKGPVIVFFVDDPENKVPLGPVEYNE